MEKIKAAAMFAVKVTLTLAVTAIVLNLLGVNLFALIQNPVAYLKAKFSPAAPAV